MADVIVDRVTKRFAEVTAVDDASLVAERETFLALLGPSGCGKTTVLRMIAGFEAPDVGDIRIDGASVLGEPPERRHVGMVFQNYALFPHMSVGRNVAYGLRFRHVRDMRRRVLELLDRVGLVGLDRRRPNELSAGQQQRVALARTLAPGPRVVLLDEPLSALDASLRENLRAEIRRIQQELRLTMVYVTHDQEESLGMSDRIAVMNAGRIEQTGSPRGIYEQPATAFVASFVGRANRLEGTVTAREGSTIHVALGSSGFDAVLTGEAHIGDCVVVFVKAEHLRSAAPGESGIAAHVVATEYAGTHTLIHAMSEVGRLRLHVASSAPMPEVGNQIAVRLDAETSRAFPLEAAAPVSPSRTAE